MASCSLSAPAEPRISPGERPDAGGQQEQRRAAAGQAGDAGVPAPDPVLHLRDRRPQGHGEPRAARSEACLPGGECSSGVLGDLGAPPSSQGCCWGGSFPKFGAAAPRLALQRVLAEPWCLCALQKVPQPGRLQADRSRARGVWLQGGNYKQTGRSGPGLARARAQEPARSHQGGSAPPPAAVLCSCTAPHPPRVALPGSWALLPPWSPVRGYFGTLGHAGWALTRPLPSLLRVITPHQLDPGSPLLGVPQKAPKIQCPEPWHPAQLLPQVPPSPPAAR